MLTSLVLKKPTFDAGKYFKILMADKKCLRNILEVYVIYIKRVTLKLNSWRIHRQHFEKGGAGW